MISYRYIFSLKFSLEFNFSKIFYRITIFQKKVYKFKIFPNFLQNIIFSQNSILFENILWNRNYSKIVYRILWCPYIIMETDNSIYLCRPLILYKKSFCTEQKIFKNTYELEIVKNVLQHRKNRVTRAFMVTKSTKNYFFCFYMKFSENVIL